MSELPKQTAQKEPVYSWGKFLDIIKNFGFFIGLGLAIIAYCVRENTPWYLLIISILIFFGICLSFWVNSLRKELIKQNNQIQDLNNTLNSQIFLRRESEKSNVLWEVQRESIINDIRLLYQLGIIRTRNSDHERHMSELCINLIRRLVENVK